MSASAALTLIAANSSGSGGEESIPSAASAVAFSHNANQTIAAHRLAALGAQQRPWPTKPSVLMPVPTLHRTMMTTMANGVPNYSAMLASSRVMYGAPPPPYTSKDGGALAPPGALYAGHARLDGTNARGTHDTVSGGMLHAMPPPPKPAAVSNKARGGRRHWTVEEDGRLSALVAQLGQKRWSLVAQHIKQRNHKQCWERWHYHLDPSICKKAFTEEEDLRLIRAQAKKGNRWTEIAAQFPGQTANAVKNRWYSASLRKQAKALKARGAVDGADAAGAEPPAKKRKAATLAPGRVAVVAAAPGGEPPAKKRTAATPAVVASRRAAPAETVAVPARRVHPNARWQKTAGTWAPLNYKNAPRGSSDFALAQQLAPASLAAPLALSAAPLVQPPAQAQFAVAPQLLNGGISMMGMQHTAQTQLIQQMYQNMQQMQRTIELQQLQVSRHQQIAQQQLLQQQHRERHRQQLHHQQSQGM